MKKKSFSYSRKPLRQILEEKSSGASAGGRLPMFTEAPTFYKSSEPRRHQLRILPPGWEDADHYGLAVKTHYGIGVNRVTMWSLAGMWGERDPISEELEIARSKGDKDYEKSLWWRQSLLMYVIDRFAPEKGPLLWFAPMKAIGMALEELAIDGATGQYVPIDDDKAGYDISFKVETAGGFPHYGALAIDRSSTPISPDPNEVQRWLEYITDRNIPKIIRKPTYEEVRAILHPEGIDDSTESAVQDNFQGLNDIERSAEESSLPRDDEPQWMKGDGNDSSSADDSPATPPSVHAPTRTRTRRPGG